MGEIAQPLPDLRNCSSTCQSYYLSWYCYFSCSSNQAAGATSRTCNTPLRQLFEACQDCNILNRGARVDVNTDYNAFLSVNDITTVSQQGQSCNDFLQWGRRCQETQAPSILSITVTDADNGTAVTTGLTPAVTAVEITDGTTYGKSLRICARVLNVRPDNCNELRAGLGLYPTSVQITVKAGGLQNVSYTVADAIFQSYDLTPNGTNTYVACIADFRLTQLLQGNFNLTITATAVNTFGTAMSTGLDASTNAIVVPVSFTGTSPFNNNFQLGVITGAAALTQGVKICNAPAVVNPADATYVFLGSTSWAVPTANADFTTYNVDCCEGAADGDQYVAQCSLNGVGLAHALNVAVFTTNVESTTISLLKVVVGGQFIAKGSITLVNAKIVIMSLPQFSDLASTPQFFVQNANVAIRGENGNLITVGENSQLLIENAFLILMDHIEFVSKATSAIDINNGKLVVSEMALFTTSKSTTTLQSSKIVQFTQLPGRVRFGGVGLNDADATINAGSTIIKKFDDATDTVSAVVAVSGTLYAYNIPTTAGTDAVTFTVPVRISTSRGPNNGVLGDADIDAVPIDNDIPGEVPSFTPEVTKKGFSAQANKAVAQITTPIPTTAILNLCGTRHTGVANGITIPAQNTLLVAPIAPSTEPCRIVEAGQSYSLITDRLVVAAGGYIELVAVAGSTFFPIRVTSNANFLIDPSAILRLTLGTGIQTSAIAVLQLFSVAGLLNNGCNAKLPRLVVTNPGNRVIELNCDATNGIYLSLSEVQTPILPQVNPALFTSNNEYCIIVNQQLDTFNRATFIAAVATYFPGTSTNLLSITSFGTDQTRNNQVRVAFRCLDFASVPAADQRCSSISTSAQTSGSAFRTAILATTACTPTVIVGANDNDDSNHGLYGLFGLIAIPILCCCAIFLVVRNSRRRADNQYMQDAATFSNVASGPQPIAAALPAPQYDLGKAYPYPTGPIVVAPGY
jgi:hypothetical protein